MLIHVFLFKENKLFNISVQVCDAKQNLVLLLRMIHFRKILEKRGQKLRKWFINANENYSTQMRNGIIDSLTDSFIFCSGYSYLAVCLNCIANELLVHYLYVLRTNMRYTIFIWRERPLLNFIRFLFVDNCLGASHSTLTWASGRILFYMETFFFCEKRNLGRRLSEILHFQAFKNEFYLKKKKTNPNWYHVVTAV